MTMAISRVVRRPTAELIADERKKTYDAIPMEKRAPVLTIVAQLLKPMAQQIQTDFEKDKLNWWKRGHFHWGLAVRNQLRRQGYDSKYFGVPNLDDIYVNLVEEALKLRVK